MPEYRVYPLEADGHRQSALDFIFPDDRTALTVAQCMMIGDARAEVWAKDRLVGVAAASAAPIPDA